VTSRRLVTSASNSAVSSRSLLTRGSSVSPLLFARAALARAKSAAPGHGCLEVGALAPAEDDQRTQFLLSRGTLSAAGGAPAVPLIACRPASTGASGRSLAPEDTRVLAGPTRGGPCRLVPVARGAADQLGRCQDARSLMVEAELLVEGQVVLDRDGCDVYRALARQLPDTCSGGNRGPSRCRKGSSPCSVGQEATKRLAHWERRVSSLPYEPVFLVCLGLMTRSRLATYSQPSP